MPFQQILDMAHVLSASFADLHMVKIDLWVLQQQQQQQQQQQVFKLDHHKFANGCKHGQGYKSVQKNSMRMTKEEWKLITLI
jgi:hypothetical protein